MRISEVIDKIDRNQELKYTCIDRYGIEVVIYFDKLLNKINIINKKTKNTVNNVLTGDLFSANWTPVIKPVRFMEIVKKSNSDIEVFFEIKHPTIGDMKGIYTIRLFLNSLIQKLSEEGIARVLQEGEFYIQEED